MEKSYYVIKARQAYLDLLQSTADPVAGLEDEDLFPQRVVVAITQGGFGQDVIDDERQVKERFVEYLFLSDGADLPRTSEAFDEYFELEPVDELIDLDEESI
jgi:hypothetical protein